MNKRCFLIGQKDSLFKQLVASLLVDMMDSVELYENQTLEFDTVLAEIRSIRPDLILLEESLPFSENSLLPHLLLTLPGLPVIVISEDSNLMHVIRCNARLLGSSSDLIETIRFTFDHQFNPRKESVV